MNDVNKVYSMLGLAMKAGKVVSGEFATDKSVKDGKAWLVIVSEDASNNTKKMFSNMCEFYEVPRYFSEQKRNLGMRLARLCVHLLQLQMKTSQNRLGIN